MEKTVYLLEDDQSICELIECAFNLNGINFLYFTSVKEFEEKIKERVPDVVLLDIMLSDGNGIEVMKTLKASSPSVYCIMLSALGSEVDKVRGLNAGADDYISKPFGILELTAKIKAVFRRLDNTSSTLVSGGIKINSESMTATLCGHEMYLSGSEFRLLKLFIENEGKVFTREKLINSLWGPDSCESRTLDNCITHLRKLGVTGIETVFGIGYRYNLSKTT